MEYGFGMDAISIDANKTPRYRKAVQIVNQIAESRGDSVAKTAVDLIVSAREYQRALKAAKRKGRT